MELSTKTFVRLAAALMAACSIAAGPQREQLTPQMKRDVARLVASAKTLKRLWPWEPARPEVAQVARHGKTVAPMLIDLIEDDPDRMDGEGTDWHVQQQAAIGRAHV